MYIRNFLTAGSFCCFVPNGVCVTIQYSDHGILEKVYRGWLNLQEGQTMIDSPVYDMSDTMIQSCYECDTLPSKVNIKNGTSWVWGVFYTGKEYDVEGFLPEATAQVMLEDFHDNPNLFNFFAVNGSSTAMNFHGATAIRSWLKTNNFLLIPGITAPYNVDSTWINEKLHTDFWPFRQEYLAYILRFNGNTVKVQNTDIRQVHVADCEVYTDEYGYVKQRVTCKDGSKLYLDIKVSYEYSVKKGSWLIIDGIGNVVYSSTYSDIPDFDKHCPVCGAPFVEDLGGTRCSNARCQTRLYVDVCHFLRTLHLPELTFDMYKQRMDEYIMDSFSDVLDLPEYQDVHIETSLADLLEAITPVWVISNSQLFSRIVSKCNNSVATILYYLNHRKKLIDEFGNEYLSLYNYIDDEYIRDFTSLSQGHPIVSITFTNKKFNGAPIFRNKTIMITGTFNHGSKEEVKSILESYSANVVFNMDDNVQCVIIGDMLEDTNGVAVKHAKDNRIPIMTESKFFDQYDIDKDMAENLTY